MSSPANGPSPGSPSGVPGNWFQRHSVPLIGAAGVIIAAVIALTGVLLTKDSSGGATSAKGPDFGGLTPPTTPESTPPSTPTPEPPASQSPVTREPPDPPKAPAAKARWTGVATLPLSTNQNSDEGGRIRWPESWGTGASWRRPPRRLQHVCVNHGHEWPRRIHVRGCEQP